MGEYPPNIYSPLMPLDNPADVPIELRAPIAVYAQADETDGGHSPDGVHGQFGVDLSLANAEAGHHGRERAYVAVEGLHCGPVGTGLTVRIETDKAYSLYPAVQVDLEIEEDLTSWLDVAAAVHIGVQEALTELDKPELREVATHPYAKANFSAPISITSNNGTETEMEIGFSPSISIIWHPSAEDITLVTPDHPLPVAEGVAGLEVFFERGSWGVNTRWNVVIPNSTTAKGTPPAFVTGGIYREF